MNKDQVLPMLSFLIPIGFAFVGGGLLIIGYTFIFIGAICFGTSLSKNT